MVIELDSAKRLATLEARGLDMADAGQVFSGEILTVPVPSRSDISPVAWSFWRGRRAVTHAVSFR